MISLSATGDIPEEVTVLFWDIDLATLDLENHNNFVIERVLNMGDEVALKWLWQRYGPTTICNTIIRSHKLTLKTARCWQNYFNLEEEQMRCFSIFWASLDSVY